MIDPNPASIFSQDMKDYPERVRDFERSKQTVANSKLLPWLIVAAMLLYALMHGGWLR